MIPVTSIEFCVHLKRAGDFPVLFSDIVPGLDLAILRRSPSVCEVVDDELRQVALRVLDRAAESDDTPGAWIKEFDGLSFFAWRSSHREALLKEIGVREIIK